MGLFSKLFQGPEIDQAKSDRSVADIAAIHERMIRG